MPLFPWYGWYAIVGCLFAALFYWLSFCDVDYLGLAYRGTPRWKAMRQASMVYGLMVGLTWIFYAVGLLVVLAMAFVLPDRLAWWLTRPITLVIDGYDWVYDWCEEKRYAALSQKQVSAS